MTSPKWIAILILVMAGLSVFSIYPPSKKIKLGLDIKGGIHIELAVDRSKMKGPVTNREASQAADRALEVLRNRVDGLGIAEPLLQRQGTDGIVIELPGLNNEKQAQKLLLSTAQLELRLVSNTYHLGDYLDKNGNVETKKLPQGITYFPGKTPGEGYLMGPVLLTGKSLVDAYVQTNNLGEPMVAFRLNAVGGRKFGQITGDNIGRRLGIILDGKVYSAPVIKTRIDGGSGVIEGNFTAQQAENLAMILKAGALPAPLKIISEFNIGPTLGADAVRKGMWAAILGLILVLVAMALYYGVSGIIADVGLLMNLLYLMGALCYLKATLTLPGIAGIVLTVGMSVDSNVLIFERIREELKLGKTIRAAIEAGYQRALVAIIDTHVTTLISAAVLFQFGTGPIKGFAVTLSLGVALSLFTAVVVTKVIFDARKHYQTLSI